MKKLYFVMICIMAFAFTVNAQKVEFNVRTGLNLSNFIGSDVVSDIKPGVNTGVLLDIKINDWMFIQPGLGYSMKGAKSKDEVIWVSDYAKYNATINLHYLEVPVSVGFKLKVASNTSVMFNTGPYIAVGVAGKVRIKYDLREEGEREKGKLSGYVFGSDGYDRFDVGWNVGTGIRYRQVYTGIQYGVGLYRLMDSQTKGFNGNLSINFGYYF